MEDTQIREDRFAAYQPKKLVPILYIEDESIQLKGTGKRKLEVHRYQNQIGKSSQLLGMHYVSSLNRRQALKEVAAYLEYTYNLKQTIIVSTSDGGSDYEKTVNRHDWGKLIPFFDTAESLNEAPHEKKELEQLDLLKNIFGLTGHT